MKLIHTEGVNLSMILRALTEVKLSLCGTDFDLVMEDRIENERFVFHVTIVLYPGRWSTEERAGVISWTQENSTDELQYKVV